MCFSNMLYHKPFFLGQEGGSIKTNLSESLISDVKSEGSWVDCVMICQFAQPRLYALGFVWLVTFS